MALISSESGEFCEGTVGHLARVDCYCHSEGQNKMEKRRLFLGALVGGPLLVALEEMEDRVREFVETTRL